MADCGVNPLGELATNLQGGMSLNVGPEFAKVPQGIPHVPEQFVMDRRDFKPPGVQTKPQVPLDAEFMSQQQQAKFEHAYRNGPAGHHPPPQLAAEFLNQHQMPPPQHMQHPQQHLAQIWNESAQQPPADYAEQFLRPMQEPQQQQDPTTAVFEKAFEQEGALVPVREQPVSWGEEFTEQKSWAQEFKKGEEDRLLNREAVDWSKDFQDIDWRAYTESLYGAKYAEQGGLHIEEEVPEYKFNENNPYLQDDDPFAKALRLMKEGNLSEAILAFEAACTKDPENAEIWRYLGQCCAENEDEQRAIASLLKCIELDPYNLDSLLMLGVSFTNELDQSRALEYLQSWITNHPDYQNISQNDPEQQAFEQFYGGNKHENVTGMFLRAAEARPDDADVQIVLGVLFNITNEYDRAAVFFSNALKIRPDDPSLWNKLGATQANGNHCSEAIEAYRRAVAIKPNYVRAYANLGISFSNEGKHFEAVQSYLASLEKNPAADHIWSLVKLSLHKLNKPPFVDLADARDVEGLKAHFNF